MPDEFQTPKEFTKPSEFPKVKEVYVSSPEFLDRAVGYGTTGKKSSADGKSKSSKVRKMMMYLAATITTMSSVLMFSTEAKEQRFDMKEYIKTHRDWYCPDDDEYIYMGDNGLAWIAQRSEDGQVFNDFYHYKKWCYLLEETGEYTFNGYGYDIDWSAAKVDSERVKTYCRFIKTDDGYIVEAYDEGDPSLTQKIYPVDPADADYPGKKYMLKYLDCSMQEILNEFNTYVMENDAPVYTNIEKIVFNPDGTGTFRIQGKDRKFTYQASDDKADNFITISYNGRSARACFNFYGERPTMLFFGGLENDPRSFAAFISVAPADADKKISSNDHVNSGDNNLPSSPDDPKATKPSVEEAEPVDASYLMVKRDWYCKNLKTCVFFGDSGTGYLFEKDVPDDGNFYSRFLYRISGSKCECELVRFELQQMRYVTEKWTFTLMKVGDEIQLWSKSIIEKGEHQVFKECSEDLNCYVNRLAGTNTGTILLQYRKYNIIEDSFIVNGITALEFTGKNSGIIYYNENGKSKKSKFTYSIESKDLDSVFYINYNGEKYLGQIFYARSGPGITLFNPEMDGTHGRFVAG